MNFELLRLDDHFLAKRVDLQVVLFTLAPYLFLLVLDEFILFLTDLLGSL